MKSETCDPRAGMRGGSIFSVNFPLIGSIFRGFIGAFCAKNIAPKFTLRRPSALLLTLVRSWDPRWFRKFQSINVGYSFPCSLFPGKVKWGSQPGRHDHLHAFRSPTSISEQDWAVILCSFVSGIIIRSPFNNAWYIFRETGRFRRVVHTLSYPAHTGYSLHLPWYIKRLWSSSWPLVTGLQPRFGKSGVKVRRKTNRTWGKTSLRSHNGVKWNRE